MKKLYILITCVAIGVLAYTFWPEKKVTKVAVRSPAPKVLKENPLPEIKFGPMPTETIPTPPSPPQPSPEPIPQDTLAPEKPHEIIPDSGFDDNPGENEGDALSEAELKELELDQLSNLFGEFGELQQELRSVFEKDPNNPELDLIREDIEIVTELMVDLMKRTGTNELSLNGWNFFLTDGPGGYDYGYSPDGNYSGSNPS